MLAAMLEQKMSVIQMSMCTQQRATEADWQAYVATLTDVQKLVHLSARMDQQARDEFRKRRFDEARQVWKQTLQKELDKWGCAGTKALPPSHGQELNDIADRADFSADSVTNTYNLELAKAIRRIGEEVPTANRYVYAYRLFYSPGGWDHGYWLEKSVQVGQIETMTHINAAVEAFYMRNGDLLEPEANVIPMETVCDICKEIVAGNPYKDVDTVYRMYDLPAHMGCPHVAQAVANKRLNPMTCRELWAGG